MGFRNSSELKSFIQLSGKHLNSKNVVLGRGLSHFLKGVTGYVWYSWTEYAIFWTNSLGFIWDI